MELNELLEIQRELNSRIEENPSKESWEMALLYEVGELCDSLRDGMISTSCPGIPGWVWWKRADRKPNISSREKVIEELADILHFILCGTIMKFIPYSGGNIPVSLWEYGWDSAAQPSLPHVLKNICCCTESTYRYFPLLAKSLGFSRSEIEEAYTRKAQKNRERWQEADAVSGEISPETTVAQAQKRKKILEDGLKWIELCFTGLPALIKDTLRESEEDWLKELVELENRLEKVLNLPLPKL